jgi:hypothetical protein
VALLVATVAIQNTLVAVVSLLVIVLSYAYSPRGYEVADGAIIIRRLIGKIRVPLDSVREARLAGPDDFRGCIRLFGSGGLFGYYGLFRTSTLGRSSWYMTDRSHAVVLIAGTKTILVSPDDTDGFLRALRTRAPVAIGATAGNASSVPVGPSPPRRPITAAILIGVGLAAAGPVLVVAAMRYDPGPPGTTLTPTTLAIHDRFYPVTLGASSVDVSGVRIVNLAEESEWRPAVRVGGFANSYYQSGGFRANTGMTMRLYRAASRRLVLLPPTHGGNPVLLEVEDPEHFVEQLRREWR